MAPFRVLHEQNDIPTAFAAPKGTDPLFGTYYPDIGLFSSTPFPLSKDSLRGIYGFYDRITQKFTKIVRETRKRPPCLEYRLMEAAIAAAFKTDEAKRQKMKNEDQDYCEVVYQNYAGGQFNPMMTLSEYEKVCFPPGNANFSNGFAMLGLFLAYRECVVGESSSPTTDTRNLWHRAVEVEMRLRTDKRTSGFGPYPLRRPVSNIFKR